MGGRLALGIAVAYPELVRSLILVSARRGLDSEREREDRRNNDERWARLLETRGLPEFLRQWDEQPLFASKLRLPSDLLRRDHERRLALDPLGLAWSLRHLGLGCQPSYEHEVEALRIPVTLITGGLDGKFRDLSDALAAKLPNARRVVVEGQGHALLLEAPTAIGQAIIEE
jgi:2-succinyl-6-hydroxy-2,4-cyclohexadiene-1-carboxylate synthase